jgi:uncharacterized Zn finger protein
MPQIDIPKLKCPKCGSPDTQHLVDSETGDPIHPPRVRCEKCQHELTDDEVTEQWAKAFEALDRLMEGSSKKPDPPN